jgi:GNAT superfamily N-acetyltransferase
MNPELNIWEKSNFIISTDKSLLQLPRIHAFLSKEAYWCLEIPIDVVKSSISNSLCFGLYDRTQEGLIQIGFARIVTDFSTFAWLCDVFVETAYRKKGLSKWLMECVMSHPSLKSLRRLCLATKDAHSLYEQYGFEVTQTPQNWMEIKDNDLYKKLKEIRA